MATKKTTKRKKVTLKNVIAIKSYKRKGKKVSSHARRKVKSRGCNV